MKKLYQGKGRRVHPVPPPDAATALALLPAALATLAAALTAEEQEVLAYLLSGTGGAAAGRRSTRRQRGPHHPEMGCGCFGCYKSFWARWDASPNRHLIHRIIDAVEEGSAGAGAASVGKAPEGASTRRGHRRRRRGRAARDLGASAASDAVQADDACGPVGLIQVCCASDEGDYEDDGDTWTDDSDCAGSSSAEKSAVGKLVRFIGEKVWAAWT